MFYENYAKTIQNNMKRWNIILYERLIYIIYVHTGMFMRSCMQKVSLNIIGSMSS
jgi:hypothetical protein